MKTRFHALALLVLAAQAAAGAGSPVPGSASAQLGPAEVASPVGGAIYQVDRVSALSSVWYTVTLRAGEESWIAVRGDGDTDLDLYVYDENWNLVASDTDVTDSMLARITPRWTGRFHLEIRNLGRVYNQFQLGIR